MNLCTLRTLVGTLFVWNNYTLDDKGLTPFLLNHKPRNSVYVFPKNDFSTFAHNKDPYNGSIGRNIYAIVTLNYFIICQVELLGFSYHCVKTIPNPCKITYHTPDLQELWDTNTSSWLLTPPLPSLSLYIKGEREGGTTTTVIILGPISIWGGLECMM